ncbi:hypothetical protein WICPIJ_000679 [Wickerhamomyces pijperi]|uniref:Importin N-terminal domain-containing protein n=1 Tax=Wickerhamomyces pijperi TaxID=599730 RepID=A0A9P8TS88_WICPI|nr:hypothetical protein WICPIJ_000679 [Wickerhamomyces pijperi]
MDKSQILNVLAHTLSPDYEVRKSAEAQLEQYERQPGFTAYCLSLCCDEEVAFGQRISASIFVKNRISYYWNLNEEKGIKLAEQEEIKMRLIDALVKTFDQSSIRPQLTMALRHILNRGTWGLDDMIVDFLQIKDNISVIYTALILLYEALRNLRFNQADRTLLDTYVNKTFPLLEGLIGQILPQSDYRSGELLYMIMKIFKYSILASIPQYLFDPAKLSTWISFHLHIIQKPDDQTVLDLEPSDRPLDKRVKARKWAFANLHKYYARYGVPISKNTTPEYISFFNKTYVNEILKVYFSLIEKTTQGYWLDDNSLYHLISFLEKTILSEGWEYLHPHYDTVLRMLLFPSLCQKDLELFEDDPEEYIRRYFDVNRDSKTPDVAAVDVLFVTVHHKFEMLPLFLNLLNEVFNQFNSDPTSLEFALKAEGGLRLLSSISPVLGKEQSPIKDQIDDVINAFVVPQLTSPFEFLRVRSCETISILSHNFTNKAILSKVFEGVYSNFQNNTCLAIQIEAADAMKVLISDPLVVDVVRNDVPAIMSKLLLLSKSFELDMIGEVMEEFVINFSVELEPFAKDLAQNLTDQFTNAATELVELQTAGCNDDSVLDKEYQAVSYIKTLTSMIVYMPKVNLESTLVPLIKFVLDNACVAFLGEALELLECQTLNCKQISPAMWELYKEAVDSFQTFASDYLEYYIPFFENIITYGFKGLNYDSPEVSILQNLLAEIIASPYEYDTAGAFEIMEYMILTTNQFNPLFSTCLAKFLKEEVTDLAMIKVLLASLKADPVLTLRTIEGKNMTVRLFEVWHHNKSSLNNVYTLKLQIYALLSFFQCQEVPMSMDGFIGQLAIKLIQCLQELPGALNRAQSALTGTANTGTNAGTPGADDFDNEYGLYGEEEDDDFKDNPLSECNVYQDFEALFINIARVNEVNFRIMLNALQNSGLIGVLRNVLSYDGQVALGLEQAA